MAQRLKDQDVRSPADRAFDDAIESSMAGEPKYPSGATFINADDAALGKAIRRAADEGGPIVLLYADGATRILRAEVAAPK